MGSDVVRLDTFGSEIVDAVLKEAGMTRAFVERLEAQHAATTAVEGPTARAIEASLNATLQFLYARMAAATLGLPYVK